MRIGHGRKSSQRLSGTRREKETGAVPDPPPGAPSIPDFHLEATVVTQRLSA